MPLNATQQRRANTHRRHIHVLDRKIETFQAMLADDGQGLTVVEFAEIQQLILQLRTEREEAVQKLPKGDANALILAICGTNPAYLLTYDKYPVSCITDGNGVTTRTFSDGSRDIFRQSDNNQKDTQ